MSDIKTKVGPHGKQLTLTMKPERFAEILKWLPEESDEHRSIKQMLANAEMRSKLDALKDEYKKTFSIINLNRFGWDILPVDEGTIVAGVRNGDFRYNENQKTWTYGPTGAFDPDRPDRIIRQDAWQVGVFCQRRKIYLLEEPVLDRKLAYERAEKLAQEWREHFSQKATQKSIPAGAIKDKNGVPSESGRKMFQHLVPCYDEIVFGERDQKSGKGRSIHLIECDIRLTVDSKSDTMPIRWSIANHHYRHGWISTYYAMSGPFDCVVEKAWGVTSNNYPAEMKREHPCFPYANRETALVAARELAICERIIREAPGEMPEPMALPTFAQNTNSPIF